MLVSPFLDGLRIVDLTMPDGWACGRVLASLGAEVIRIDPPGAAMDRAWQLGNVGKRCVAAELSGPSRDDLRSLMLSSDAVIESFAPGQMDALGLGYDSLRTERQDLVWVSMTPFGGTGPYAGFRGGELVVAAMSGTLGTGGHPDRWPVKEAGDALSYHASLAGALGAVAALRHRRETGAGQRVDISSQEVGATRNTIGTIIHQFDGRSQERLGPLMDAGRGPMRVVWELEDGFAVTSLVAPGSPNARNVLRWMTESGFADPLHGVDVVPGRPDPDIVRRWEAGLADFLKTRTRAEVLDKALTLGTGILPVNEPRKVVEDRHLAERGFFDAGAARLDGARVPNWFVRTLPAREEPATLPDSREAIATVAARAPLGRGETPAAARSHALPLAGIKVLDFSWAIVGNTAAKMLGDLGADIVKVENPNRVPHERAAQPVRNVPDGPPDNSPWFANVATSKRSIAIDLQVPASRSLVDELIDWADVVFENFSPGVMQRLGLDYAAIRARKPDIIMASGSIFGQTGPLSSIGGSEVSGSAWAGRVAMTGDPDRTPIVPSVTYGDSITPFPLATAIIAAVMYREPSGEGCYIDGSMVEVLCQQLLPFIDAAALDIARGGSGALERTGNRSPDHAPHNVFRCRGDDAWIAIAAYDDEDFRALCVGIGQPDLAEDARFADGRARKRNEAALEAIITAFTAERDPWRAMEILQSAGVPAGAVQRAADILERDPQLAHRGYLQEVDHPVIGPFLHQRTPIALSATPPRMFPAPRLGEHAREICRETLGMSEEAFTVLVEAGVFGPTAKG